MIFAAGTAALGSESRPNRERCGQKSVSVRSMPRRAS